ncbi:MAG: flavodoxin-dependent (E)-4-hydroxy-3-methylbut-2-enyl-diphosphate synthase [Candidatus Aureabacteria bacterium]|nr:flavodoxin-dependent (E)-4-hydroxy-3-methylbut-2-enyl-diphosphate synthase [Candidatus Auribacterota bacterium]
MDIKRKKTIKIILGPLIIGGGAPISVQSMTKTRTSDVAATVAQCERLAEAGCEIVRVAIPDEKAARAIGKIKSEISIPLVADVHFNYRLALIVMDEGADGIRINPGNIGGVKRIAEIAKAAAEKKIPIRVGVNSGSVEKRLIAKYGRPSPRALAESAIDCVKRIEDAGHESIKISVKAASVRDTIEAYECVSAMTRYPLHVGVTEAGPPLIAAVRSAAGIGHLLLKGIGDTIRVSVTGDPLTEVAIAKELLQSLELRQFGPTLISCPTCGRCEVDIAGIVEDVQRATAGMERNITIAIMGCVVNGPGEAREADVGLACGRGSGIIFRHGKMIRRVKEVDLVKALLEEIRNCAR